MSSFNHAADVVLGASPGLSGRAWIAFHRCVEAHCGFTGERFNVLFERLATAHGFSRAEMPDVGRLRAATRTLMAERAALLGERAERAAARRSEKRAGRRAPPPPALAALESGAVSAKPLLGAWGWRALREGRLGPAIPGAVSVHGTAGGRVCVDLRGHLPSEPLGRLLRTAGARQMLVFVETDDVEAWVEWLTEASAVATLRAIRKGAWGPAELVVVGGSPGEHAGARALRAALRPVGWTLARAGALGAAPRPVAVDPEVINALRFEGRTWCKSFDFASMQARYAGRPAGRTLEHALSHHDAAALARFAVTRGLLDELPEEADLEALERGVWRAAPRTEALGCAAELRQRMCPRARVALAAMEETAGSWACMDSKIAIAVVTRTHAAVCFDVG